MFIFCFLRTKYVFILLLTRAFAPTWKCPLKWRFSLKRKFFFPLIRFNVQPTIVPSSVLQCDKWVLRYLLLLLLLSLLLLLLILLLVVINSNNNNKARSVRAIYLKGKSSKVRTIFSSDWQGIANSANLLINMLIKKISTTRNF